jgi:hypothetical protein
MRIWIYGDCMSGRDEVDRLIMKVMEETRLSYPVATYLSLDGNLVRTCETTSKR